MIDPIGVSEIADMLGVSRQQVSQYKFHGKLPAPEKVLAQGPIWDKETIIDFISVVGISDGRKKMS
jgi:predicted transcriptional regulator